MRNSTGRWCSGRVAGRTREGTFETGEQIDEVGCFEDAVTLSPDAALAQHAGSFESVDGFTGSHRGSPDQSCGAVDCDHRDTGGQVEEPLDRRVGADSTELFPPSCIERFDLARA